MEILSANVENQKVLIMVYQKFKDSNPGTLEQLLMEAESKSRDCLLQIFSMDFDEDTSDVNALPHFNKEVTEFQFLGTYKIFRG